MRFSRKHHPSVHNFSATLTQLWLEWASEGRRASRQSSFIFDRIWPAAIRKVHDFIDERVREALEITSGDAQQESEKNGAAATNDSHPSRTILLYEMAASIRDPVELRYQILNIFLPGRDTTAVLLSNVLFYLSRSPHLWSSLRAYALEGRDADSPVTFVSLKAMTPLRDVLYEVLRLRSPAGRSSRWACRDSALPTGGGPNGDLPVSASRGTAIQMALYSMHRDPRIWGKDANEFRPKRWEEMSRKVKWEFVPFLGGGGICPAQQLVLVQATYVLWRILCEFNEIECRDEEPEFVEMARMLLESRNGAKIALKAEKES